MSSDIPYLAQIIGEENLITGSDYGHHGNQLPTLEPVSFQNRTRGGDPSADLTVMGTLQAVFQNRPNLELSVSKTDPIWSL